ncbi:MAG TPA: ATP-binding protein [Candidatus Saccharimonadales bacterium]
MTIRQRLHRIFIAPRHHDEDIRNREVVLNVLLTSTLAIALLALTSLIIEIIFIGYTFLVTRACTIAIIVLFVVLLSWLSRRGWLKTASLLLVGTYFLLAFALAYQWGINLPTSALLFGLVIVLSGILLGPAYSLYAAILVALTLAALMQAAESEVIYPDWSWALNRPGPIDVAGFSFIFGVIALVSWLFNQQMARSLHKAEKAEAALTKQKLLLESTVEERTRELQAAQLEKVQQMYRFAELGQLSTALIHDLANHLTTLTLNIESLEGKERSTVLKQAKQSISHIDDMVVRVRDQLHGRTNVRTFNVATEIEEMAKMLRHRSQLANVQLTCELPIDKKALRCHGEPIRFRQMIANLIGNGIDAYHTAPGPEEKREVLVAAKSDGDNIIITVSDWGCGIPQKARNKLFEPFHSTKDTGMGMGLFIVKQIAEEHFLGSVVLDRSKKHTAFLVKLPKAGV